MSIHRPQIIKDLLVIEEPAVSGLVNTKFIEMHKGRLFLVSLENTGARYGRKELPLDVVEWLKKVATIDLKNRAKP